jgi:hypothetical protein
MWQITRCNTLAAAHHTVIPRSAAKVQPKVQASNIAIHTLLDQLTLPATCHLPLNRLLKTAPLKNDFFPNKATHMQRNLHS